jgi:hypothetical protein
MPAQWPIFINKVSAKLSSQSSSSIDEFAVFVANEYFNSVKTSQTMFGNMHQPGQKTILEEGFKKAFKKIYEEEEVLFDSKATDPRYADMFEKSPGPDVNFDPYCELEKWTEKNKDNLEKFIFYPFFPSTCPTEETPKVAAVIDYNLLEEAGKPGPPEKYITMAISGFTEGINYKFLYSINGEDQPIQIASDNVLRILAPIQNGSYVYIFKGVYSPDGITLLKEINQTITLEIKPEGVSVIDVIKDPFADKKPRGIMADMTPEERIKNIALRVIYQNDGSAEFGEWVDRLDIGYNKAYGKKIKSKIFEILGIESIGVYEKIKNQIAHNRALKKAESYRKTLMEQFNKQGNQGGVFGITLAYIKKEFESELKKYEKEYKGTLTERDVINDILKENKNLKEEDAFKQIYGIPKPDDIKNPINEYIFQEEHSDNKNRIPEWLTAPDICKFVFFKQIDDRMPGYSNRKIILPGEKAIGKLNEWAYERTELRRNSQKILKYLEEKNKWYALLMKWGNSMAGKPEEDSQGGDGYDLMAKSIIDYWKSTAVQPFKPGPPIIPCTSIPPLGGKYAPISYGNKNVLAGDLRKAWNTGKRFKKQPLTPTASKAVASAVSVACAKHLLGVKFLYLGGMLIPSNPPIPMVGVSPTTF